MPLTLGLWAGRLRVRKGFAARFYRPSDQVSNRVPVESSRSSRGKDAMVLTLAAVALGVIFVSGMGVFV